MLVFSAKQKQAFQLLERDKDITEILYGGAAGGGKSFLGCYWQIWRRMCYPNTRGFIGRDTLSNLRTTTLKTFNTVWHQYFSDNPWEIQIRPNMQEKTIFFSNGSEIALRELAYNSSDPEFNTLGSVELTDAFIDEVPGITEKAVDIVSSRIRHNLINDKPCLLLTGNPTRNWVKDRYVTDKDGNAVQLHSHQAFIKALLSDNPDPKFQANYKRQLEKLPMYDRRRLLDGDWEAVEAVDNPFMYAYNPDRHIGNVEYNPNQPLLFSIDFNINPFCAIVGQVYGTNVFVFEEIEIPQGNIEKMSQAIMQLCNKYNHSLRHIKITGDRGGMVSQLGDKQNASFFRTMMRMLSLPESLFLVPPNPFHKQSRIECNAALMQLDVKIGLLCRGLQADMRTVECDEHGSIKKKNRSIESQRADFLDCFRYLINTFAKKNIKQ